jgi:N6-L-threonylcarbamoyladenine synthase
VKEIAFEFEMAVTEVLAYKLLNAAKLYWVKTVMLAWGVSANKRLKAEILSKAEKEGIKFLHPVKNVYSMDNAAMVGINAFYKIKHKRVEPTSGVVAP